MYSLTAQDLAQLLAAGIFPAASRGFQLIPDDCDADFAETNVESRSEQSGLSCVVIDSRKACPGSIFFALPGRHHHGMEFAHDAVGRGATCIVAAGDAVPSEFRCPPHVVLLTVPDAANALRQLAIWNRQQSSALVIGVTGSVGKTTTRQLIWHVLSSGFCGVQSPLNYNNHLGVPLTLLEIGPQHDFAVVEIAAASSEEIRELAEIVQPEMAVVTRVSEAHLPGMKDLDGIQACKGELVEAISETGTVFLNADDDRVRSMSGRTDGHIVLFGESDEAAIHASLIRCENGRLSLTVNGREFTAAAHGRHLATAATAAIGIGLECGLTFEQIRSGLVAFQPDEGRGRVVCHQPWTVIDDSYNASPASVKAAARALRTWTCHRHRILVLGDMLDLGEHSQSLHQQAGTMLTGCAADHIVLYGDMAETTAAAFVAAGGSRNHVSVFHCMETLLAILPCFVTPGDVVLVKGSRAMRTDRIVQALVQSARSAIKLDRAA